MPMPPERIGRCSDCPAEDRYPGDTQVIHYGSFPGGDPRRFSPDPEMATAEEIHRHSEACKEANTDQTKRNLPPDGSVEPGAAFNDKYRFGPGVWQ
jgi:hypothetical protein